MDNYSAQTDKPKRIALWRRRNGEWRQISGYASGPLHSSQSVQIEAQAQFIGNLTAPRVHVSGTIVGDVAAEEVLIRPGGHILGDVFAVTAQVLPGGKIEGWLNTIEPDDRRLREPPGSAQTNDFPEPAAIESAVIEGDDARTQALRRLQEMTAAALAARAELERAFAERVAQATSESQDEAERLRLAWQESQQNVSTLTDELHAEQQARHQLETELSGLQSALQQAQLDNLSATDSIKELNAQRILQAAALQQVEEDCSRLNISLQISEARLAEVMQRAQNLEAALEASIQNATEQEDALLHWQELAQANLTRIEPLLAEVNLLRESLTAYETRVDAVEQERDWALTAYNEARAALESSTAQREVALALQEAQQRIAELEAVADERAAQLRRNKELLDKTRQELAATKALLDRKEKALTESQQAAAAGEAYLAKARIAFQGVAARLRQEQQANLSLQQDVARLAAEAAGQQENLRIALSKYQLQAEAIETERNELQRRLRQNVQRIGEMEKQLTDQQEEIGQLRALVNGQYRVIEILQQDNRAQPPTTERSLAEAQRQVSEWLAALQRRGRKP